MWRQQVGRQINALQLGMDHFSRQLSTRIIIIKKVCLQKCSCYQGTWPRNNQFFGEKKLHVIRLAVVERHQFSVWQLSRQILICF